MIGDKQHLRTQSNQTDPSARAATPSQPCERTPRADTPIAADHASGARTTAGRAPEAVTAETRAAAHIFSIVERAGHRLTEPRRELIRAVSAQAERPFTGEDLYDELRETGLGRATVFRTLKLLLDLNVLSRLHMEDGCQQYILAPGDDSHGDNHHDRLICRECGRVSYLDLCPMEDVLPEIARRFGYNVEGHHLDIIGLCGECHGQG